LQCRIEQTEIAFPKIKFRELINTKLLMTNAHCDYQLQSRVMNIFISAYGLGNHTKIKQPVIRVQNVIAFLQIIEIDKVSDNSTGS
jgi:hypothetical protein